MTPVPVKALPLPIGLHVQDPLTPEQDAMLFDGIRRVHEAGYALSFTFVNGSQRVQDTRALMPDAQIIYRYEVNQPFPRGDHDIFETGETWFQRYWPGLAYGNGADYFQFVNEWLDNEQPAYIYERFAQFYIQLGVACLARGVIPTFGDFSTGTPPNAGDAVQGPLFTLLDPMFRFALQHQIPINQHWYAPEGSGNNDMEASAGYYVLRGEQIASRYPGIMLIGGEGGNAGPDGMYRDTTPQLMRQAARMLRASPYRKQLRALNWWEITNGEANKRWAKDDWTGAMPWFFEWSSQGQPT